MTAHKAKRALKKKRRWRELKGEDKVYVIMDNNEDEVMDNNGDNIEPKKKEKQWIMNLAIL